jgi:hypothetical protein
VPEVGLAALFWNVRLLAYTVSGGDLMLLNLAIAAFEKARWPTKVLTGRYAFQLGDGTRNVAQEPEGLHDPKALKNLLL